MARYRSSRGFTLVEIMIVVLIIGLLLAIAIPNWMQARSQSQLSAVLENLNHINTAKNQFAMQTGLTSGAGVTEANLYPTYLNTWPTGPTNSAVYVPQTVGTDPTYNGKTALTLQTECGTGGSGCPF